MFKRLPLLVTLLLFIYAFATIDPEIQAIVDQLAKFRKNYPQEKIYLHLDKPFYSLGDTLYFKAYLVNAENNSPSTVSNILYVDLTDDGHKIHKTICLQVTDGITRGSITMSDTLPEGNYTVRAYTNWMRNFDDGFYFSKNIQVGNAFNNEIEMYAAIQPDYSNNKHRAAITYTALNSDDLKAKEVSYTISLSNKEVAKGKSITDQENAVNFELPVLQTEQEYELVTAIRINGRNTLTKKLRFILPAKKNSIQFFPEGGQMVNGFPIRMGFKAMNETGLGVNVSGEILDESRMKVADFTSGHAGIGSFLFTPLPGHKYHAIVKFPGGNLEKIILPMAMDTGYVLAIDNTNEEKLLVQVFEKGASAREVILIGQSNSRVVIAQRITLAKGTAITTIPNGKLPTGITQFTLFDAAMRPVAERLIFIDHHDQLQISLIPAKAAYSKQEKVTMALEVKDVFDEPVSGSFSVAVTDGSLVPGNAYAQTINSNLLLNSDIKGYIEDPGYYFTGTGSNKTKALDDLLMTQGWRRFTWKSLLANDLTATRFSAEKSLAISGTITSLNGEPLPNAKLTLLSKKGAGFVLDTISDNEGQFIFDHLSFTGNMLFAIKGVAADGSNNVVVKLNEFTPPPTTRSRNSYISYVPDSTILPYLVNSNNRFKEMRKKGLINNKEVTLQEVTLKAKEITQVQEAVAASANLNGPGNADQVLTYLDLPNCNELTSCLPGKVRGVSFKAVLIKSTMCFIPYANTGMGKPMLIVLDGFPMNTVDGTFSLSSLAAGDIQSIEVLRTGAYLSVYGPPGSAGVLVITSKKGGLDYTGLDNSRKPSGKPKPGMVFFTLEGHAASRQFYVPDLSNAALSHPALVQSTIYWNPDVVTNDDGKATIEFNNNTTAGKYNVVVEGISGDGKIGTASFSYK